MTDMRYDGDHNDCHLTDDGGVTHEVVRARFSSDGFYVTDAQLACDQGVRDWWEGEYVDDKISYGRRTQVTCVMCLGKVRPWFRP